MQIRLAAPLQPDSIVDGEGIRAVLWTQGCHHHCKGCHNQETWDFNGGYLVDVEEIKKEISELQGQDGITLSGGDPMFQVDACLEIAKYCKELNLNVWCYTGYTFDQLLSLKNPKILEFLNYIDVLVDGKFILEGLANRIVAGDVPNSLKERRVVLIEKYLGKKEYDMKKRTTVYL